MRIHTTLKLKMLRQAILLYHVKKAALKCFKAAYWRRERDSNPRVLSHKLISSQPRYDHFDISPYEVREEMLLSHANVAIIPQTF